MIDMDRTLDDANIQMDQDVSVFIFQQLLCSIVMFNSKIDDAN